MKFTIKNSNDYITLQALKIDNEWYKTIEFKVNAKCGNFIVENKQVFSTKYEINEFLENLQSCYDKVSGEAVSDFDYSEDFKVKIVFGNLGKVVVEADIEEYGEYTNKFHIEFGTDQTFIAETLKELKEILK